MHRNRSGTTRSSMKIRNSEQWSGCRRSHGDARRGNEVARDCRHDRRKREAVGRELGDADLRAELTRNGLETIRARHTCAHRARELLEIADSALPAEVAAQ